MSLLLLFAGAGAVAPPPPSATPTTEPAYSPNLTAGATGLDPYRPWREAILDGEFFLVNGWDTPRRWDRGSNFYLMGSVAPTSFATADAASGSTFPAGRVVRYYLVFAVSSLGKETAPQGGAVVSHTMTGTKSITITWTTTEPTADQDVVRIYRALDGTGDFFRVASVAKATGTYTDSTSDATLRTSGVAYVPTYRTTLPPLFEDIAVSQGRLFGWVRDSELLYYAQAVRVDGNFRADDFPSDQVLPVGANEGTGQVTAMLSHYGTDIIWKRRAIYEKTGSDVFTWSIQRLSNDRGALNSRCVVPVDGHFLVLDEIGVYAFTPGADPIVAGALENSRASPFQPIFDRMNLSARLKFHAIHFPIERIVVWYVALDFAPVPNVGIVFDYGNNRFVGLDTGRYSSASGFLEDASGTLHPCRGCDMGYLWEDYYLQAEGVFSGTTDVALTSAAENVLTASGATFETGLAYGVLGSPLDWASSSGVVVEENRVYAATGTTLTLYFYPSVSFVSGDTVTVGVIRGVFELAKMTFQTHEMKWVREVFVEFNSGVDGTFFVDTAVDDSAFVQQWEQIISTHVRGLTVTRHTDRCWTWSFRARQSKPGLGFSIRGLHVHWDILPGQYLP